MSRYGEVKRLVLIGSDYEADVSFDVSFGKVNYTMKGTLDLSSDPKASEINKTIISDTYEDLRNIPTVFRSLAIR
jgi:hypothetical protein